MTKLSKFNRRTVAASALVVAGVTGTIIDPDGPVGITLFGVAAVAVMYLIARLFRKGVRRLVAASRPKPVPRRSVARAVRGRTVAIVMAAMGALFTLWLTTDLARPLVYLCWWGFSLLAAWLTAVTVLAAYRSLGTSD
jgi:hypothetical protein